MTYPASPIWRQWETAAQLRGAKVLEAVIKVSHGSFDTHANQFSHHERLLKELAERLVAFRQAMVQAGLWNRVLMMTYLEFGRRVGENASAGTDHGSAAISSFFRQPPRVIMLPGHRLTTVSGRRNITV